MRYGIITRINGGARVKITTTVSDNLHGKSVITEVGLWMVDVHLTYKIFSVSWKIRKAIGLAAIRGFLTVFTISKEVQKSNHLSHQEVLYYSVNGLRRRSIIGVLQFAV